MPLPKDVARALKIDTSIEARLQVISIFLVTLVAMSFVFKVGWNYLGRDFERLPKLTFGKSLFGVLLWGVLFVIVLTMISGARELMTPGAWKKNGLTYSLDESFEIARRQQLERLGSQLQALALQNEGSYPAKEKVEDAALWEIPGAQGMHYLYYPGDKSDPATSVLVCENNFHGDQPFALMRNGTIKRLSNFTETTPEKNEGQTSEVTQ